MGIGPRPEGLNGGRKKKKQKEKEKEKEGGEAEIDELEVFLSRVFNLLAA